MVSLNKADGPLQSRRDQVVDCHGRGDRVVGRSDALELQRRPRDGGDQTEGKVERRQNLGAVQGEIALGVGCWPEDLKINPAGVELCLRWRGGTDQSSREYETKHVLAKIHAFLRRVRSGRVLRPTAFAGHRFLYISGQIPGKGARFNLGRTIAAEGRGREDAREARGGRWGGLVRPEAP